MDLPALISAILPHARFRLGADMDFNMQEYQHGYRSSRVPSGLRAPFQSLFFPLAEVEIPRGAQPLFDRLVDRLRDMLQPHVDSETSRIGFSTNLPLAWSYPKPDVVRFSKQLLRCAALAGTHRAIELLEGCTRGDAIPCTHVTILEGIRLETDCLAIHDDTRFQRLSNDPKELVDVVPDMLAGRLFPDPLTMLTDDSGWLAGATALFKESYATLAISTPALAERSRSFDWGLIPDSAVFQAVSLACDSHVAPSWEWFNVDRDLAPLAGCQVALPTNVHRNRPPRGNAHLQAVTLTQGDVDFARTLHDELIAKPLESQNLVAYERWHSSKTASPGSVNGAIDTRIALEALFSGGGHAELRHRIALRGAWYLGSDAAERHLYFHLLKRAYDLGSKAVHTGHLDGSDTSIDLLNQAQDACRTSLIKHIKDGVRPDEDYWSALVLDGSA